MPQPADHKEPTVVEAKKSPHRRRRANSDASAATTIKSRVLGDEDLSPEQLQTIASHQVRRSTYGPDWLKDFAKKFPAGLGGKDSGTANFKLVTGDEAASIYEEFLKEDEHGGPAAEHPKGNGLSLPRPVVLALPAQEAGRKVIDYYMTWRGKAKTHRLKGGKRKVNFLDNEFKKVAKTLDKEFNKRFSLAGNEKTNAAGNSSAPAAASPGPPRPITPPIVHKPHSAPEITQTSADALAPPRRPGLTERPPSIASVTSLPFLGMVRGVPMSNRLPLRLLNPDPISPTASVVSGQDNYNYFTTENPAEPPLPPIPESDAKGQVIPDVVPEEADVSPDGKHHSRRSRHHTRDSTPRTTPESSRERKTSNDINGDSSEILIVLMDESKDGGNGKWHEIDRRDSSRLPVRKPSGRLSPWNGPAAHAEKQKQKYLPGALRLAHRRSENGGYSSAGYDDDSDYSDSDNEDGWKNQPVIPLKAALAALGHLPQDPAMFSKGSFTYGPVSPPPPTPVLPVTYPSPVISLQQQYSPYQPAAASSYAPSPYAASPYATPYNTPYNTPYAASVPSLPPVASPYMGSQWSLQDPAAVAAASPYQAPLQVTWPASQYSSPYVPPKAPSYY